MEPSKIPKRARKVLTKRLHTLSQKIEWELQPEILQSLQIPKPMHGLAPRVVLGTSWWNKTRKAAYASTDYHCAACGVAKHLAKSRQWLEGHELYKIDYRKGQMVYVETVPLCTYCHHFVHPGRLQWLLETGRIHQSKYVGIITHGNRVLNQAGLKRLPDYTGPCAAWEKWRLVVNGKRYKPVYKSLEHWIAAFGREV